VDSSDSDFIVLELEYGIEKILIGVFYRSPNSSQASDEELYLLITLICSKFNCKKIIVGDFNFSHINWDSVPGTRSSCIICNEFVDMQKNS